MNELREKIRHHILDIYGTNCYNERTGQEIKYSIAYDYRASRKDPAGACCLLVYDCDIYPLLCDWLGKGRVDEMYTTPDERFARYKAYVNRVMKEIAQEVKHD